MEANDTLENTLYSREGLDIYFMGSVTPPSTCYAHFILRKLNRSVCTFLKYRVKSQNQKTFFKVVIIP